MIIIKLKIWLMYVFSYNQVAKILIFRDKTKYIAEKIIPIIKFFWTFGDFLLNSACFIPKLAAETKIKSYR